MAALLHTPAESFDKTVSYVNICALGAVFTTAYNVISGIMRGIGNAALPLIFVSIACITNILGDLLLVGLLGMDASGAAIATVSAQGLSALLSLLIIGKQGLPFAFPFAAFILIAMPRDRFCVWARLLLPRML